MKNTLFIMAISLTTISSQPMLKYPEDTPAAFRIQMHQIPSENSIKYQINSPNGNTVEVEYFTSGPKIGSYEGTVLGRYGINVLSPDGAKKFYEDAQALLPIPKG